MKKIKAPPGARRLIESLRNMGYDCSTAIADLVDNSIAANASEVRIDILPQDGERPPAVVISDNGRGMDGERLQEAMRFGAFQEYSTEDLGKYGLGLKTASLSQCRCLTVSSKARTSAGRHPRRHLARWDLDFVDETDDWDLLLPQPDELKQWERELLEHSVTADGGTIVLWTGFDEVMPLLAEHDIRRRETFLAKLLKEVGAHLRMVFHRFMGGGITGRRKLRIFLCDEELRP
jgi:Histidine kinase-, DNA gyrase B-, and HSP90-like ATPase